ncbi:MAG: glucose 1-dehydrogenase [Chloroflexi bacterium]|nr:glucose 1-dehydrogenase [Chloroflexota bacterium]
MKAIAVFPETREVKLIDHDEPQITTPTQVKLRTLEVGVCGTDKKITSFQFGTPPAGYEYLVIGHEMLGEVVEVGSEVHTLKPGDLAVTMVRHPCSHASCRACRMGRQDFCFTGDFAEHGIKEVHGFMTELVVDEERYMHPVPRELRDVGVLTEPLTVAEKGIAQVWHIQQRLPWIDPNAPVEMRGKGLKAMVLGAGTVGLLGAMLLITTGFETYVYSRSRVPNPKADLVEAIGGTYISNETTSVEQLARQVGNIDLVYEASGASRVAFDIMRVMGTNAIFVSAGVPEQQASIEVDTDLLLLDHVLKNQVVFGTVNADQAAFEAAIRDLAVFKQRWPQALHSLITGRYPIEQAPQLLLGSAGGIKNIVTL